jgi:hypothetical protein
MLNAAGGDVKTALNPQLDASPPSLYTSGHLPNDHTGAVLASAVF